MIAVSRNAKLPEQSLTVLEVQMNKWCVAAVALVAWGGALAADEGVDGTVVSEMDYGLPRCDAPVASVKVGAITCKAAACRVQGAATPNSQIEALMRMAQAQQDGVTTDSFVGVGEGMVDMLTTALQQTGCVEIQDAETAAQIQAEMEAAGLEYKAQPVDFLLTGSITAIQQTTERKKGLFLNRTKTTKAAQLDLDYKIVDVRRGSVMPGGASTFHGDSQATSAVLGGGGGLPPLHVSGDLKGTPIEDVIRDVLGRVAAFTANKIIEQRQAATAASADVGAALPAMPAASSPAESGTAESSGS